MREAEAEPAELDRRGRVRCNHDVPDAELSARDLQDDVRDSLPDFGSRAMDGRAAVGM